MTRIGKDHKNFRWEQVCRKRKSGGAEMPALEKEQVTVLGNRL